MRISDWSSDVCSSDRVGVRKARRIALGDHAPVLDQQHRAGARIGGEQRCDHALRLRAATRRERGEQGKREQAFDPHRASLVSAPMKTRRIIAWGALALIVLLARSEERSVGKECVRTCRSWWWSNP